MALWHIQRIEQPPVAGPEIACIGGSHPVRLFLVDLLTGARVTRDHCQDDTDLDGCGLIRQLVAAGDTPTDSNDQCSIV